jgi:thiamine transporter ThiT
MDLVEFIRGLTLQVVTIAWFIFVLAWFVGWALKGAPVPFYRLKRTGQSLVEDAIIAAFWLALGSSIFSLISYIASNISQPTHPPPQH